MRLPRELVTPFGSLLTLDRVPAASEVYTAWVRSGHCPGDGPDDPPARTAVVTENSFATVLDRRTLAQSAAPAAVPQLSSALSASAIPSQAHARLQARLTSNPGLRDVPPSLPSVTTAGTVGRAQAVPAAHHATSLAVSLPSLVRPGVASLPSSTAVPSLPPLEVAGSAVALVPKPASAAGASVSAGVDAQPSASSIASPPVERLSRSRASPKPVPPVYARSVRTRKRLLHQSVPESEPLWVDTDIPCAQCRRPVSGRADAILCDIHDCVDWLVCKNCVTAAGLDMRQAQYATVLCPKHQLLKYLEDQKVKAGLERALMHAPGSIGRFLGCITAFTVGMVMSDILAKAPVIAHDPAVPSALLESAYTANDAKWDQPRRVRLRAVAFKLLWLATKLHALDLSVSYIRLLAEAYCRHRLSDDRPPGWARTGAKHVASELSAMATAADDLSLPYSPYSGAKRCLEARGAFLSREHSPKWPIIPCEVFALVDAQRAKGPLPPKTLQAVDALEWNAFWGLRPLYLEAITKANLHMHNGGFLLRWTKATKTKRGDRLKGADAALLTPQISSARHPRLTSIYASMQSHTAPFKGYRDEAIRLLREWFAGDRSIPEGFTLCLSGQRNGVDMAMLALGLPADYTDAHLWWARQLMRGYYAGLQTGVTMAATDLFHLVVLMPIAPGWYDKISMPSPVDWSKVEAFPQAMLESITSPVLSADPNEEADGGIGPIPSPAPTGVPRPVRRKRHS